MRRFPLFWTSFPSEDLEELRLIFRVACKLHNLSCDEWLSSRFGFKDEDYVPGLTYPTPLLPVYMPTSEDASSTTMNADGSRKEAVQHEQAQPFPREEETLEVICKKLKVTILDKYKLKREQEPKSDIKDGLQVLAARMDTIERDRGKSRDRFHDRGRSLGDAGVQAPNREELEQMEPTELFEEIYKCFLPANKKDMEYKLGQVVSSCLLEKPCSSWGMNALPHWQMTIEYVIKNTREFLIYVPEKSLTGRTMPYHGGLKPNIPLGLKGLVQVFVKDWFNPAVLSALRDTFIVPERNIYTLSE